MIPNLTVHPMTRIALATLLVATPALAASGDLKSAALKLSESHKDSIVWLTVIAKTTMTTDGDAPPQIKAALQGQDKETKSEATGTIVPSPAKGQPFGDEASDDHDLRTRRRALYASSLAIGVAWSGLAAAQQLARATRRAKSLMQLLRAQAARLIDRAQQPAIDQRVQVGANCCGVLVGKQLALMKPPDGFFPCPFRR